MTVVWPTPRVPDPADAPALRWGIAGAGWIAEQFTATLRANTTQRLVAVASRSDERAHGLAAAAGIERVSASYDALFSDPDVDVVYVSVMQNEHADLALRAIAAGKHVLVEKPFTTTAAEARQAWTARRAAAVFCVEAMWPRSLRLIDVVRQLLPDGALGDVRLV